MPVIDALKYRIAGAFQLYLWFGVPLLVIVAVLPLGRLSLAAFWIFFAVAVFGGPIMFLRCDRCGKEIFYDPASRSSFGPDINLFRRVSPVCRNCGAIRAKAMDQEDSSA